jgi:putative PIN family toxin of toxin-antitoxin system
MTRPRIILDTNIVISAALQPAGLPAQLLELVAYRAVELCVSEELLTEYREVLGWSGSSEPGTGLSCSVF